ncbi:uncharacterized protein [Zea mays]|uniref:uncharacterized protein isoform X1 n=1 Tax=Zea mays TaxID=4577 RepID=UPI0009AA7C9D|nr:uncharacterized protein LOC103633863 isoform X1 [Zea mays]|eukprot:XP_020396886.1 uncharacterized protein LOC103633863 [Zea mays]
MASKPPVPSLPWREAPTPISLPAPSLLGVSSAPQPSHGGRRAPSPSQRPPCSSSPQHSPLPIHGCSSPSSFPQSSGSSFLGRRPEIPAELAPFFFLFPPWPKDSPAVSSATMACSPGSELLPCFAVGRPCHYLAPSSRSELHRQPAQQAARSSSSHEILSVSPASTRSAQRCRSTAAAPCCAVDLRGSTVSASRFAESAQRRRATVGTRALVDVTPCASLVGKEPKLMACIRGTSRPGQRDDDRAVMW